MQPWFWKTFRPSLLFPATSRLLSVLRASLRSISKAAGLMHVHLSPLSQTASSPGSRRHILARHSTENESTVHCKEVHLRQEAYLEGPGSPPKACPPTDGVSMAGRLMPPSPPEPVWRLCLLPPGVSGTPKAACWEAVSDIRWRWLAGIKPSCSIESCMAR